ncbi:MAG: quinoprotein relay system zinc metallohydrolase 2 [Methylococcaceae bacterium]|nr:quinoprotein relay system zinc metallohydrolase 2 [Methylococcaceae bacterium]
MKTLWTLILLISSQYALALDALSIKEVSKGIYVHFGKHELPDTHNHGAIANIGFIVGEKCVAVIDSGGNPEEGQALKKAIQATTDKPVCYVINTHVHPDHIYGNIAFKAKGVEFVGHHKLARAMASRSSYYVDKAAEQLAIKLTAENIILPTLEVKNTLKIDLGGRVLELTAHPTAHTDNDLSIYDKQTDTLWLSDLLFREHLPVLDGSLNGWIAELERLEKNNYRRVIAGHGALVTDWKHSLQPQKRYLIKLRDQIRSAIKQGQFLEDALKTVAYSESKSWKLFNEFHRKNITSAFAELEWEE